MRMAARIVARLGTNASRKRVLAWLEGHAARRHNAGVKKVSMEAAFSRARLRLGLL